MGGRIVDRDLVAEPLQVLSLGAGVQSSTMALMAAHGEFGIKPDCAIFADTGAEPKKVYEWLETLTKHLHNHFPVFVVQKDEGLLENIKASIQSGKFVGVPFYTESATGGREGMLRRQCTREFKIEPIEKEIRRLVGLAPGQRGPNEVIVHQWIGISLDEALRQKPARTRWIRNVHPLIDWRPMRRWDCLCWMRNQGYPEPVKSACKFCPYRDNAAWQEMWRYDRESFEETVEIDEMIRPGVRGTPQKLYVHRQMVPLREVNFEEQDRQIDMWIDECEGMCGV